MADYWVSTPKYWCKYCKVFVKDTTLEKRNHEATGRHQGALQRFLKDLHRTNEREVREAQRAKDEVARLNGLPPGGGSASAAPLKSTGPSTASARSGPPAPPRQATAAERKQQMAQLAAMGVVVPEEYRRENAMVGEWETTAVSDVAAPPPAPPRSRPLGGAGRVKKEDDGGDDGDDKADVLEQSSAASATDQKRKLDGEDDLGESEGMGKVRRKPNWGSDVRSVRDSQADTDLDALLAGTSAALGRKVKVESEGQSTIYETGGEADGKDGSAFKVEEQLGVTNLERDGKDSKLGIVFKGDGEDEDIGSLFKKKKKRKAT